jgi:hypothetical protein
MVPNSFLHCFLLLLTSLPTDTAMLSPILHILPVNAYWFQLQPLLPEGLNRAGDAHHICTLEN